MCARLKRPPTPKQYLRKLPQFQAEATFELADVDVDTGRYRLFDEEFEREIDKVLSDCIRPHAREIPWINKPTTIDRFLSNAKAAIATYIYQRNAQPSFDRKKARAILEAASAQIMALQQHLISIQEWRPLNDYLERIFTDSFDAPSRSTAFAAIESFSTFSPRQISSLLYRLEAVIAVAAEKVTLDWGDAQRDEIAQRLTNEMAFAWISGTGQLPTASKTNARSKTRSPFLQLLSSINSQILEESMRSPNEFRDYATRSVRQMKSLVA